MNPEEDEDAGELRKRFEAFDLLMAQTGPVWLHDAISAEAAEKTLHERMVENQFTVLVRGPYEKPESKSYVFSIAHRPSIEDAEARVTHEEATSQEQGFEFRGMTFASLAAIKDTFFGEPAVCLENPQRVADLVVIESLHRKLEDQLSKTRLSFELFPDRRTIILDASTTAQTLAELCSASDTDTFHLAGTAPSPERMEFRGDVSVREFKSAVWDKWDNAGQAIPDVFRYSNPLAAVGKDAVPLYFFRSKLETATVMAKSETLFVLGSPCNHTYDNDSAALKALQKQAKRACPKCHSQN